jgi:phage FluMu gp28-like protein
MSEKVKQIFLDPVTFFRFITDFEPTEYQKRILLDPATYLTIRASRQSGKTEVMAVKVLLNCVLQDKFQTLIIAPTQRQSSIVFNKIDMYLMRNEFLSTGCVYRSKQYIQFSNGSEIYNLPGNNAETVRGYSPNMIIVDEAAYVKDAVYEAIQPSLSATGGRMVLISSPFGKRGKFYDSHNSLDYYSKYHVSYTECPFLKPEHIERERQSLTEMQFQQEYEADFVEEADTFFSLDLIKNSIASIEKEDKAAEGDYYLGVDPAWRGTDEAVYIIAKAIEGLPVRVVCWEATSKKPLTDVMGRVQELNNRFNFQRIFLDATGLGAGVSDFLSEQALPIEAIIFTQKSKQDLYNNLKRMLEKKELEIPDEQRLIYQLAEIQYEYSSNGLMKIHHPDRANAHDDWCDALALAVYFNRSGGITVLDGLGELINRNI